jgi:hypothetical protein
MSCVPQGGEHTQAELYFTYRGLLRCLFCSRKPVARTFVTWAEDVLFAAHLGTPEQREELAGALVGVDVDIVRQFAKKVFVHGMSGIYLLLVGDAGKLGHSMGLAGDPVADLLVVKFGRSEDIDKRLEKHNREYGSLKGAKLELVYFAAIDPRFQSQAEKDVKEAVCNIGTHLKGVKIRGQEKTELVLMTRRDLNMAAKHLYQRIAAQYAGCLAYMQEELKLSKAVGEQKDLRLLDKDEQLRGKDNIIKCQTEQIQDKNALIEMLRAQVEALKIKAGE